ncbi:MAG: GldG family protein [Labilithrix sp.]|nr:GldG family protein [Labilithrix sp.]MBX3221980.1 GldG family protein [Labilithrix sp.]
MARAKGRFRLPRVDPAQASVLVGIALAMVVVVLVNVVSTRRFTRWDWTSNKRYSLTPATIQTLRELPETIQVWVLLGPADPLEQSVKQLLVSYQAETTKLDIHYVDPDRDVVALEDVKKRFKIETGRTEQGHVVADAIVVVARGERHWFLSTSDMVEISAGDDTQVKPKEERALTGAIRNVLGSEKAKLCFTTGHGEMSPDDPGREGAGMLRDVLEKDNYELTVVDPGAPNASDPFASCGVVVVAGLRGGFTDEETERLRTYLLGGGNLLLATSPITGSTETGLVSPNLDRALAPFGIALDEDLVIEEDPELAFPGTGGIRFVVQPRPHALTAALVKGDDKRDVPRTVLHFARSMRRVTEPGSASPADLLMTSQRAFGLANISGASEWKDAPAKKPGDLGGPLSVAMAAERAKTSPSAAHGPRVVVVGSASALTSPTFREPLPLRGAALFVESAISWLASKPQVLDVPDRTAVPAGIRITEDDRAAVRRYVLFMMPGTVAVLGIVIALWRRRTEGAPGDGGGDERSGGDPPKTKPSGKRAAKPKRKAPPKKSAGEDA